MKGAAFTCKFTKCVQCALQRYFRKCHDLKPEIMDWAHYLTTPFIYIYIYIYIYHIYNADMVITYVSYCIQATFFVLACLLQKKMPTNTFLPTNTIYFSIKR